VTTTPKKGDPVEVFPAVVNAGQVSVSHAHSRGMSHGTPAATPTAAPAASLPTQMRHPWRSVARTWVAAGIGFAALADPIYEAATHHDAAAATGFAATALAVCGGVTKVLALPGVEKILRATPGLRWLAAAPAPKKG
jgi:hypothetical protein